MSRLAYRCQRDQSQQVYFPQDGWRAIGRNARELNSELRHRLGAIAIRVEAFRPTVWPIFRATASATRFHSCTIVSELPSCSRRRAWE